MEDKVDIKVGLYSEIGKDASIVRNNVFCIEQGISRDIERDSFDETCIHAVLYKNNKPVSVGRIINKDNNYLIGRVATLKDERGNGYGGIIVKTLVDWAFNNNINEVYLHSQKHAEEFYKKLGFESFGNEYLEAGIEHISMVIKNENN